jgi:hypothetical protein
MKNLIRATGVLALVLVMLLSVMIGASGQASETGCYSFMSMDMTSPTVYTSVGSPDGNVLYRAPVKTYHTMMRAYGTPPNAKLFYQSGGSPAWLYTQDSAGNVRRMRNSPVDGVLLAEWSPDGKWVAYLWMQDIFRMLSVVDEFGYATRDFRLPLIAASETIQWSPDSRFLLIDNATQSRVVSAYDGNVIDLPYPAGSVETSIVWAEEGHRYLMTSVVRNGTRTDGYAEWGEVDNPQSRQQYTWANLPDPQSRPYYLSLDKQLLIFKTGKKFDAGQLFGAIIGQNEVFPLETIDADEVVSYWHVSEDRRKVVYIVRFDVEEGGRFIEYDIPTRTRRVLLESISDNVYAEKPIAVVGRTPARENVIMIGERIETLKTYPAEVYQPHLSDTIEAATARFSDFMPPDYNNLFSYPALWQHKEKYVIRAGDTIPETVITIYDTQTDAVRTWRKPGNLVRLATLGDWIGVSLKDAGGAWLVNIVTGAEVALGMGEVVWDDGMFVLIEKGSDTTTFTMIDADGRKTAVYRADDAFSNMTPRRSPDNRHAIIHTFDPTWQQLNISVFNGSTGQRIWNRKTPEYSLLEMRWLPDSSGFLIFSREVDTGLVTRVNMAGETVWTRTLSDWSFEEVRIVSCSVMEQVDQLRLRPLVTPDYEYME